MQIETLHSRNFEEMLNLSWKNIEYHQQIDSEKYSVSVADKQEIEKGLRSWIACSGKKCFLAKIDGTYSGYVRVLVRDMVGFIGEIFVDKRFRHKGIGTELLSAALQWLEERKVEYVQIRVDARNRVALMFYEKQGFVSEEVKMGSQYENLMIMFL